MGGGKKCGVRSILTRTFAKEFFNTECPKTSKGPKPSKYDFFANLQGDPNERENAGPCVVILDKDTAFLVGGADGKSENRTSHCDSYFLDLGGNSIDILDLG